MSDKLKYEGKNDGLHDAPALTKDDGAAATVPTVPAAATPTQEKNAPAQDSADAAAPAQKETAGFGKFSSAESLFEAYRQLEARFTKKCQRLSELEQYITADNAAHAPAVEPKENSDENPQPLDTRAAAPNAVCDITQAVPDTVVILQDAFAAGNADAAAANAVAAENFGDLANDEEFLNDYIYNNKIIKNKIISTFVKELSSVRTPKTISGGGNNIITPVHKPKTLGEAKQMTEFLFNA
jgi:hypothetical protein